MQLLDLFLVALVFEDTETQYRHRRAQEDDSESRDGVWNPDMLATGDLDHGRGSQDSQDARNGASRSEGSVDFEPELPRLEIAGEDQAGEHGQERDGHEGYMEDEEGGGSGACPGTGTRRHIEQAGPGADMHALEIQAGAHSPDYGNARIGWDGFVAGISGL